MTNIQKKPVEEKSGVNPVVAAVAGVVIGAGIALTGAFAADKDNQKKLKKLEVIAKDTVADVKNIWKKSSPHR